MRTLAKSFWVAIFLLHLPHIAVLAQPLRCIYPPPNGSVALHVGLPPSVAKMHVAHDFNRVRPATGQWKALVILVDFPDFPWHFSDPEVFSYPDSIFSREYFESMLFTLGQFRDPLSQNDYTGSMRDYYREISYGMFDVLGQVTPWVRADHPLSYYANPDGRSNTYDDYGYGTFPKNAQGLVHEVVQKVDDLVNFKEYDNDGDGEVDALFIVHAGPAGEELYTTNYSRSFDFIWSHAWSIPPISLDGVTVKRYTIVPANGTIGVFCHEFGHVLGLPDLYDPDGTSEGIGEWGLMGSGGWCYRRGDRPGTSPAHMTSWSKYKLGWLQPREIRSGLLQIELQPIARTPQAVLVRPPWFPSGEYFLLENRQPIGFDAGLTRRQKDFDLEDPRGLLILHIDEERGNQSNDRRRLVDVEEATPFVLDSTRSPIEQLNLRRDLATYLWLFYGNRGDDGDLWPGFHAVAEDMRTYLGPRDRVRFDDFSIPSASSNDGELSGIAVDEITLHSDGMVSFTVDLTRVTGVMDPDPKITHLPVPFSFDIFPNPGSRRARVLLRGLKPHEPVQLTVFDILGREINSQSYLPDALGRLRVPLSQMLPASVAPGAYFVQMHQGRRLLTYRFTLLPR